MVSLRCIYYYSTLEVIYLTNLQSPWYILAKSRIAHEIAGSAVQSDPGSEGSFRAAWHLLPSSGES